MTRRRKGENNEVSTLVWKKPENREKQRKEASEKRRKAKQESYEGISAKKDLEIEESIWKDRVRANTSTKGLGSYNWVKRGICAKKEKSVYLVYFIAKKDRKQWMV